MNEIIPRDFNIIGADWGPYPPQGRSYKERVINNLLEAFRNRAQNLPLFERFFPILESIKIDFMNNRISFRRIVQEFESLAFYLEGKNCAESISLFREQLKNSLNDRQWIEENQHPVTKLILSGDQKATLDFLQTEKDLDIQEFTFPSALLIALKKQQYGIVPLLIEKGIHPLEITEALEILLKKKEWDSFTFLINNLGERHGEISFSEILQEALFQPSFKIEEMGPFISLLIKQGGAVDDLPPHLLAPLASYFDISMIQRLLSKRSPSLNTKLFMLAAPYPKIQQFLLDQWKFRDLPICAKKWFLFNVMSRTSQRNFKYSFIKNYITTSDLFALVRSGDVDFFKALPTINGTLVDSHGYNLLEAASEAGQALMADYLATRHPFENSTQLQLDAHFRSIAYSELDEASKKELRERFDDAQILQVIQKIRLETPDIYRDLVVIAHPQSLLREVLGKEAPFTDLSEGPIEHEPPRAVTRKFSSGAEIKPFFDYFKAYVPNRCVHNGCHERANYINHVLKDHFGFHVQNHRYGSSQSTGILKPIDHPKVMWIQHFVPVVELESGDEWVLDLSLKEAMPLDKWKQTIEGPLGKPSFLPTGSHEQTIRELKQIYLMEKVHVTFNSHIAQNWHMKSRSSR